MNPQQLTTSLSNLVAWFPAHDPFELLQQNPQILENPNVEADPTYGKWGRWLGGIREWQDALCCPCGQLVVCAYPHGSLAD